MKILVVVSRKFGPVTQTFSVETEGNWADLAYVDAKMKEFQGEGITVLVSPDSIVNKVENAEALVEFVSDGLNLKAANNLKYRHD